MKSFLGCDDFERNGGAGKWQHVLLWILHPGTSCFALAGDNNNIITVGMFFRHTDMGQRIVSTVEGLSIPDSLKWKLDQIQLIYKRHFFTRSKNKIRILFKTVIWLQLNTFNSPHSEHSNVSIYTKETNLVSI